MFKPGDRLRITEAGIDAARQVGCSKFFPKDYDYIVELDGIVLGIDHFYSFSLNLELYFKLAPPFDLTYEPAKEKLP